MKKEEASIKIELVGVLVMFPVQRDTGNWFLHGASV
jgi:hypothetical protein